MNKASRNIPLQTVLAGKYRLDEVIGCGGMGCVYRATNVILKSQVALKVLQGKGDEAQIAIQRFHREAQVAASIGHGNICEVIDFGVDCPPGLGSDIYFLVMPFLKGRSFGSMLADWRRPTPAEALDIISQTLLGLQAAHEQQVVHRDLKPDNIFVTELGDRRNFVKILDFGISKYLDASESIRLTQTGITIGTPLYMAPEQAAGASEVDRLADIYSMGVVLYEALVGRLPYEGDSFNEVLVKISSEPFPAPRDVNPSVPRSLEGVILKAMSRNPAERFESAIAMREALQSAAEAASENLSEGFNDLKDQREDNTDPVATTVVAPSIPPDLTETTIDVRPSLSTIEIERKMKDFTAGHEVVRRDSGYDWEKDVDRGTRRLLVAVVTMCVLLAALGIAYMLSRVAERPETDDPVHRKFEGKRTMASPSAESD